MKLLLKKKTALLLALVMVFALCSCSPSSSSPSGTTANNDTAADTAAGSSETPEAPASEPAAEEPASPFEGITVKVGCSATFVPYESIEMATDGKITYVGMNINIITSIIEKNGGKVEFQDMPFKSLIAAIQANQIDFCSGGMTPNDERRETLDFSEIFFYPRNAIVFSSDDDYPSLDSLQGKKVAYVFGTNYQQIAESIEGAEIVGIQGSPACVEEVKSGRADACIIDGAGAVEYLKVNEGLSMTLLEKLEADSFAIGFPKGSPYYEAFNNTLIEMMNNGELDEIVAKHLSEEFIF